jgi:hypothetical protein
MKNNPNDAAAVISQLPAGAARTLAVEILLADPEWLADDVLESCLYLLRERLREESAPAVLLAGVPAAGSCGAKAEDGVSVSAGLGSRLVRPSGLAGLGGRGP